MRRICLLALFLLACLTLDSCSPASPTISTVPDTPSVPSAPSPTLTLTPSPTPLPTLGVDPASLHGLSLQVWHAYTGQTSDLFTRQADQFSTENEWGIKIKPTGYGDYPGLFEAVNTALNSGQSPDLVIALPEQALSWDAAGAVVNLNPYFTDPQWALPVEVNADIPSIFLAQDNTSGKQLGLPAQRSARFIFYNQTWAHELGFTSPPSTPHEFSQQACAANASFRQDKDVTNDVKGGWVLDTRWQTSYSWLLAFGGGMVKGPAYAFHTDPNLAALKFIKDLYDSHCAWPSETPYDSFASRTALFISADLSEIPATVASMARFKNSDVWTVIPFPASSAGVVVAYGPSYSLLKSTPAKQLAAWLFVRWLLAPESQAQWVEAAGLFPLRKSVLGMVQPYRLASPQWEAAVGYLSLAQGVPHLASWRKVRYVLEDGLTVFFRTAQPVDKLPSLLDDMDSIARELK
jgi:multiple sugar transport system substrate-binding protein